MQLLKTLIASALLSISALASAADTRFDSFYFFQPESVLQEKGVNVDSLGRYTRAVQTQIYKSLKNAKLPASSGYLVIAIRSDEEVATWLDMKPVVHEYYDNQIYEVVKNLQPPQIKKGIFVFAIKMAIDTPVHTKKSIPNPPGWDDARKKLADPGSIEHLVLSLWPE
ncbi:MAG: hypothetical protein ACOYNW_07305 [Undibacterium curvum]|uniref:hypothetical protein n=1 Tax=Undibacterium curvum TaxID=2762294 RepID=UPI003BE97600